MDLTAPSGKIIVPPWSRADASSYRVTMPVRSLQALFELMSFLGPDEYRRRLHMFTDLSPGEIDERVRWLNALYDYLWQQGLRPHKVKREYIHGVREWARHKPLIEVPGQLGEPA